MNVLLIADIGTNQDGYYHIGDEAMFFQTYEWYKKQYPNAKISALSRSPINSINSIQVKLHLGAPEGVFITRLYLFVLIAKYMARRFLKLNLFSKQQDEFVAFVLSHDVLHFTGGGNFYSLHPPWLYYMFFLIFLAMATLIGLREPGHAPFETTTRGVKEKAVGMLDVAYDLPKKSTFRLAKKPGLRIGLSIHPWNELDKRIEKTVRHIIENVSRKGIVEVVLIPHILEKSSTAWGLGFMKNVARSFPKNVKVTVPTYDQLMESAARPEMTIKYLTSAMDLMICSRYHGIVFALSESVPVIALSMDAYYNTKNLKALEHVYCDEAVKYFVDVRDDNYIQTAMEKVMAVVDALPREKEYLQQRNKELVSDKTLFNLDDLPKLFKALSV